MKLSIITINFNNLAGLQRTYESVVCQTFTDYEWIVIDGGSTDGSREFIEQHQEKFAYWCSEPDKGVYNAMNKGIGIVKGEFINFMNSGDCFAYPTTLETVFSKEHNADIIYGYMMRKTLDGIPHNIPSMKQHLYWEDFYFDTLPHQSSYIKRSLFDKLGGYDESYPRLADWKWFTNAIIVHGASVEFLPKKLSVYECGGISEDGHWREDLVRLRNEIYPNFIKENDLSEIRELRSIKHHRLSMIIYKIIRKLVRKYEQYYQEKTFRRIRAKE